MFLAKEKHPFIAQPRAFMTSPNCRFSELESLAGHFPRNEGSPARLRDKAAEFGAAGLFENLTIRMSCSPRSKQLLAVLWSLDPTSRNSLRVTCIR